MLTPFYLIHSGHYLGGVIVVVEENLNRAKERIEKELKEAGVALKDFDLSEVKHFDLSKPNTIYLLSGDY